MAKKEFIILQSFAERVEQRTKMQPTQSRRRIYRLNEVIKNIWVEEKRADILKAEEVAEFEDLKGIFMKSHVFL
jgi:hypothetical protein